MSYQIGVQNGLLETKHYEAMGSAVWLYMWLIDHQPRKSDQVHGGRKSVTYSQFAESVRVNRDTYNLWIKALVDGGYITTKRSQYGLIITIEKAKKWYDQQNSDDGETRHLNIKKAVDNDGDTSDDGYIRHLKNPDDGQKGSQMTGKLASDDGETRHVYNDNIQDIQDIQVPKGTTTLSQIEIKNDTENDEKIENQKQQKIDAIIKLRTKWVELFGTPPDGTTKMNGVFIGHLLNRAEKSPKRHEDQTPLEYVERQLDFLAWGLQNVAYMPTVASFIDLYNKQNKILQAYNRHQIEKKQVIQKRGGRNAEYLRKQQAGD